MLCHKYEITHTLQIEYKLLRIQLMRGLPAGYLHNAVENIVACERRPTSGLLKKRTHKTGGRMI